MPLRLHKLFSPTAARTLRSLRGEITGPDSLVFHTTAIGLFSLKLRLAAKSRISMFLQGGMARDPFGGESRDLEPFTPN
jgi:hypothetical protein